MKKLLFAAMMMTAGAALAATELDSSLMGFVPVAAGGLTAVSVPVTGYTAGTYIKIAEVLQTANLTAGDKLYTMTDDGKYNEYVLQKNKTWLASSVVTVVGGSITAVSGTPATEATVKRGKAFWIQTSATQVNVMGQATDKTVVISYNDGWDLIGNPSMTAPLKVSTIKAGKGSRLNVGTTYYQKGASKWYRLPDYVDVKDTDVIAVGQGAMLLKK